MRRLINKISDRLESTFKDVSVIRGTNKDTGEETVIRVSPRLKFDKEDKE